MAQKDRREQMKQYRSTPEYRVKQRERSRARRAGEVKSPPAVKTCVVCAKPYPALNGGKTCGPECSSVNRAATLAKRWERKAKMVPSRTCIICGAEFKSRRARQFTCGPVCSVANTVNKCHERRGIVARPPKQPKQPKQPKPVVAKPLHAKTCIICTGPFETRSPKRLTCGTECSKQHARNLTNVAREKERASRPPRYTVKTTASSTRVKSTPAKLLQHKQPRCVQTPNPRRYRATAAPIAESPGLSWDMPGHREPVPLLVAPEHVVDRSGLVTVAGVRVEPKVGDWRRHWC